MIGMVLAAGAGKRLGDETADLPKTLLGVDGDRTILDVALANFRQVGLERAVIVTGHAHERVAERVPELERHAVAALQRRHALGQALMRVAGDDDRLLKRDVREVAERDVEDRAVAVDAEQRLRQVGGLVAEPRSSTCGEHHPDHSSSSSSSSFSGRSMRPTTAHPYTASATNAVPSTPAMTKYPAGRTPVTSRM